MHRKQLVGLCPAEGFRPPGRVSFQKIQPADYGARGVFERSPTLPNAPLVYDVLLKYSLPKVFTA